MDKLVSIIVPVYNAKRTLRKCVESVVYGSYANVEVILVDDCSKDGSWELCCELHASYPQVKCVQNPTNSGVSCTRNRGLEESTGDYICFVDSDDWVCGRFIRELVEQAQGYPRELPVCGFRFMNYVDDQQVDYLMDPTAEPVRSLPRAEAFSLLAKVWMQCVWNKLFLADVIRTHKLCFEPGKSMGEDFDFVLSYLEQADLEGFRIIDKPLYYYVRANSQSLMSKFGLTQLDEDAQRYERVYRICSDPSKEQTYRDSLEVLRENFFYQILHTKQFSKAEKLERIRQISKDGMELVHYRRHMAIMCKENVAKVPQKIMWLYSRIFGKIRHELAMAKARKARRQTGDKTVSIISQNCIGGVLYHDLGQPFRSPTINLYLTASDFVKFVGDLRRYLSLELEMHWDEEFPVGTLGDIKIYFMHYETCHDAKAAWERRCQRIDWDKILILSTDRDGFGEKEFEAWKEIPYPKVLFTGSSKFREHPDSLYIPGFDGPVGDLIPKRQFYRDGVVTRIMERS